jgi:mRNA-degrading endonuclease toxin of MazEF toxin-antitoxin module
LTCGASEGRRRRAGKPCGVKAERHTRTGRQSNDQQGFSSALPNSGDARCKKCLIVLDQIRSVDNIQLVKRVGAVNAKISSPDLTTLQEVFAD